MKYIPFFLTMILAVCTIQAQDINLSFQNPEVTTEGQDSFYEVDVMMTSEMTFSLGSGQFFLDYSAAAFGTQVANNNMITFERPDTSLLGGEVIVDVGGTPVPLGAHYTSFITNDTEDTKVSFIWQQNASSGMFGDNVPAGTPVALVHVKIQFLPGATGENPEACFDATNPFDDQFFTACGPFDPLVGFNFEGADCQGEPGSQIFDYTPDCSLPGPFEIACQNSTVQLNENGTVTITPETIFNGDPNDPSIDTLALDIASFDCSNIGENTVTLTATNVDGSTATCTAIVTVEDTLAPEALCQNITLQLDANGNASITAADIDNGSTDNCGVASLSINTASFNCANLGENTVTLTVTDTSGNMTSCDAMVTVEDTLVPEAICQAVTVQLDATGIATITATDIDGGSTDNCGIASLSIDIDSFDCTNVGENTVLLTVVDTNGNEASCTTVVTVEDTAAPEVTCQDITVQLDATGIATITAESINNGASDNCAIETLSIDIDTFTCTDLGENTVTLTVTDTNGNEATCTAIVTVEDLIAPTAICQDITLQLDENGEAAFDIIQIDGGSTDNCDFTVDLGTLLYEGEISDTDVEDIFVEGGNPSFVDAYSFVAPFTGTYQLTHTTTGDLGALAVLYDAPPVRNSGNLLTRPEFVGFTLRNPEGVFVNGTLDFELEQGVTYFVDITTSQSGQVIPSYDGFVRFVGASNFSCENIGVTELSLIVSDLSGNTDMCIAMVTVEDPIAPEVVCPEDQTIELTDDMPLFELPDYFATGDATALDNCEDPVALLTQDPMPGTLLDEGIHTITLCATDSSGNETCCTFEVTVEDVLSVEDATSLKELKMYPNPARDQVFVANPKGVSIATISIYDLRGRLVARHHKNTSIGTISFDVTILAKGVYIVEIQGTLGNIRKQLIKR